LPQNEFHSIDIIKTISNGSHYFLIENEQNTDQNNGVFQDSCRLNLKVLALLTPHKGISANTRYELIMKKQIFLIIFSVVFALCANGQEFSEKLILSLNETSALDPGEVWVSIGKSCNYDLDGKSYSYLSTIIDTGFEATPFNEIFTPSKDKILSFVRLLRENGCNINVPHPETGHLPIHSAAFFYRKNTALAKYIVDFGGDLSAKTPDTDLNFPNMTTTGILNKIIEKYPPQPERVKFLEYINR
jgi:hypothetical protein